MLRDATQRRTRAVREPGETGQPLAIPLLWPSHLLPANSLTRAHGASLFILTLTGPSPASGHTLLPEDSPPHCLSFFQLSPLSLFSPLH